MSFPADDIVRARELANEGLSACAISRYIDGVSLGTIRTIIGRKGGNVVTNNELSVRERVRYLNWQVIKN